MKRFTIMIAVAGLALAACSSRAAQSLVSGPGSSSPSVASPSPEAPSPQPAHEAKATKAEASPAGQANGSEPCGPQSGGTEGSYAELVDVRVGAHDGYDRVTFEFASYDGQQAELPGYVVAPATPPITQDGSGATVSLEGDHFATVVFDGASGWDFLGDGHQTYDGPMDFQPGFDVLAEATETGDFEAVLSWAFGLSQDSCPTVLELQDPVRLAIDFPQG
jgi:hypothetical protein